MLQGLFFHKEALIFQVHKANSLLTLGFQDS